MGLAALTWVDLRGIGTRSRRNGHIDSVPGKDQGNSSRRLVRCFLADSARGQESRQRFRATRLDRIQNRSSLQVMLKDIFATIGSWFSRILRQFRGTERPPPGGTAVSVTGNNNVVFVLPVSITANAPPGNPSETISAEAVNRIAAAIPPLLALRDPRNPGPVAPQEAAHQVPALPPHASPQDADGSDKAA